MQFIDIFHIQIEPRVITRNRNRSGAKKVLVPVSGGNLLRPGGGGKCFLPRLPCNDRCFWNDESMMEILMAIGVIINKRVR